MVTKCMAIEFGHPPMGASIEGRPYITFLAYHPGNVITDMNPQGLLSADVQVAKLISLLNRLTTLQANGEFITHSGLKSPW